MEYQHGGDIYRNQVGLDFSANINPLGMPEPIKKAMAEAIEQCCVYPDSQSEQLSQEIGRFHGVHKDMVICSNGAADLIFQLVLAVKPGKAVLVQPTFLEYQQALQTVDCHIFHYFLKKEDGYVFAPEPFVRTLEKMETPDIIFLCNPNNPTGLAVEADRLTVLLDYCEANHVLCVVDECFNEFMDRHEHYSLIRATAHYSCLFILKAFTKLYAIPGVRLGYGICRQSSLINQIQRFRQPWSVSVLAQRAGEAALQCQDYVEKTRALIQTELEYMKNQMRHLGFYVYESMGNYLFFQDIKMKGNETSIFYEKCLEHGVLIRSCSNYMGLDHGNYRICIKTREENNQLITIFNQILEERKKE